MVASYRTFRANLYTASGEFIEQYEFAFPDSAPPHIIREGSKLYLRHGGYQGSISGVSLYKYYRVTQKIVTEEMIVPKPRKLG